MTAAGGRFVGRQRELDTLTRVHEEALAGSVRVVEIVGDPGIGKTRLVDAFGDRLRASGRPMTIGRAAEFEQEVPFAAFADALDRTLDRTLDQDQLAALGPETVRLLAKVFPTLSGQPAARPDPARPDPARSDPARPDPADRGGAERYRLHQAVRRLMEVLAEPGGLTLVLEDVHWADAGSVEQLDYLLRYPPRAPFLLVLTYRQRQASPRLLAALAQFAAAGQAPDAQVSVELEPLRRDEIDELIGAGLDRAARDEVYRVSGGNPFYVDALVRTGEAGRETNPVAAELTALSPVAAEVARAGAAIGEVFNPELVAVVAELPHPTVLAALDELASRDVIRAEATAGGFRFRHPLVRNAAYHTATGSWRRAAHRRAAAHLRAAGASAVALAHHVERAARPGDDDTELASAVAVLVAAADAAVSTVPELAARWLRVAIDLLPAGDNRQRAELTLGRARALAISGRCAESLDLLRDLLDRWPADQPGRRAETAALCATMLRFLGRHDESLELLEAEVARLPDQDTREAAALKLELTYGCMHGSRWPETFHWAAQVLETSARHPGRTLDVAGGTGLRAMGAALTGDQAAWEYLAHAGALLDSVPDGELAERLNVAAEIGWAEVLHGRFQDARRHYTRGVALARASGKYQILVHLLYGLCSAYTWLGQLAEAVEAADDALEVVRTLGERNLYPAVLSRRGELAFLQGDLATATRYVDRSVVERAAGTYLWTGHAELIRARIRLADPERYGDPDESVAELLEVGGGPDFPTVSAVARSLWYDVMAQAELAHSRVAGAVTWADRAAANVILAGVLDHGPLTRARALLGQAESAPEATRSVAELAADLAAQTAQQAAKAGARLVEADARRVVGTALAAGGDLAGAQEELRRAKALYADCGANGLHAEVVAEQRRLGSRTRRRSRAADAPVALTEREHEIARLVALGDSNRQIATKLALSPKTVESHLSRAFVKLGVSTRTALVLKITTTPEN